MRRTRRGRGRNAEFYAIDVSPSAELPADIHTGEELSAEQRGNFRLKLYDDFPGLLQPINSLPISRQWDRPIEITGPMKRQRLNILSSAERA
jgi:hypothetical protein